MDLYIQGISEATYTDMEVGQFTDDKRYCRYINKDFKVNSDAWTQLNDEQKMVVGELMMRFLAHQHEDFAECNHCSCMLQRIDNLIGRLLTRSSVDWFSYYYGKFFDKNQ